MMVLIATHVELWNACSAMVVGLKPLSLCIMLSMIGSHNRLEKEFLQPRTLCIWFSSM